MGFYEEISKYYDYIFPVGDEQVRFIEEFAGNKGSKLLDVACGSGEYTAALAENGYKMTAVDLDDAMVHMARIKMERRGLRATVMQADMKELKSKIDGIFKCVFCIGNSIVHLGSYEDILDSLRQMNGLLEDNGTLVIQIINYDRIIKYGVNELPPITNQAVGIEFIRKYEHNKEKGVINFNTTLEVSQSGNIRTFKNTVELLPILSNKMMELLQLAGFRDVKFYGDFKKAPYNDSSYMLVAEATK